MHDYGTDSVKWHIFGLKIEELEKKYEYQFDKIREFLFDNLPDLRPKDISFQISDLSEKDTDRNGFPGFGLFIEFEEKAIEIELDIYNYNNHLLEIFMEKYL